MADTDIGKATTTDLQGTVQDVTVSAQVPDAQSVTGETWWDYPKSSQYLGYYKEIPELKSAIHVLTQRVCGLGWEADARVTAILEGVIGWGEDSLQSVCQNLLTQKKVFGDAFAEIIRTDDGTLINLKPLYPGDMSVVVNDQGLIVRYEQRSRNPKAIPKKFRPEQILHLVNDRIANEIHGISVIESLKIYIDFYNELLSDERKIRHRELALGVLEVDTDDDVKTAKAKKAYQDAVNKGEVLVLPKGGAELKDNPNTPRDRLQLMQFVINQFYQVVGTPKVLVTSEGFTEAGGKAGLLAFEPTEIAEKQEMENDLWNQVAIRVKFTRTPSLLGEAIGTEQKNAGQTGIQPNETQVTATRTE